MIFGFLARRSDLWTRFLLCREPHFWGKGGVLRLQTWVI